jgi:chorismate mutase
MGRAPRSPEVFFTEAEQVMVKAMAEVRGVLAKETREDALTAITMMFYAAVERGQLAPAAAVAMVQLAEAQAEIANLGTALEAAKIDVDRLHEQRAAISEIADQRTEALIKLMGERDRLAAQVARVRERHTPYDTPNDVVAQRCRGCIAGYNPQDGALVNCAYPCPTIRALDGDPS